MRNDLQVLQSVEINSGISKVWHCLTTPDIIKDFLFGTETVTDWKVGSEIIFQGEYNGASYRDKGVIRQCVPNEILSYTYWSGFSGLEDKPENYSLVTVTLKKLDENKTLFTWNQQGFATEENQQHAATGLDGFLSKVKEVMER